MAEIINFLLTGVLLLLAGVLLWVRMSGNRQPKPPEEMSYTLESMTAYVKQALHELTSSNLIDLGLSEEEFRRRKNKRVELKKALRGCNSGDHRDKAYVKQFMSDLLQQAYHLDEDNLNRILPFNDPYELSAQDQFEILLYQFKKRYRQYALQELME